MSKFSRAINLTATSKFHSPWRQDSRAGAFVAKLESHSWVIEMNRADFHKLTEIRMREAKVLLDRKCDEGAYYLAGYAVECALKACIAKKTLAHDFPPKAAAKLYT